jgi:hypothetical protein
VITASLTVEPGKCKCFKLISFVSFFIASLVCLYSSEFDELGTDLIPITTNGAQAYGSGASTFFFRVYGPLHPNEAFERIQPGWNVVGQPTWIVTSVVPDAGDNNESCTITITGGSFIDTTYYAFTNGISTAIARRENKNGRYQVSGYFDEYTGF